MLQATRRAAYSTHVSGKTVQRLGVAGTDALFTSRSQSWSDAVSKVLRSRPKMRKDGCNGGWNKCVLKDNTKARVRADTTRGRTSSLTNEVLPSAAPIGLRQAFHGLYSTKLPERSGRTWDRLVALRHLGSKMQGVPMRAQLCAWCAGVACAL